jgi:acyl carrier protein
MPNAMTRNTETVVKQFIIEEFLPDVGITELDSDYDLTAGGVIDSLGLLKTMAWLEDRFGLRADRIDLSPDNFRSVAEISRLVEQAKRQQPDAT